MKYIKNYNLKTFAKDVSGILTGSFLSSFALYSFIIPNNFVSGGVGGIAVLLESIGLIKSYLALYLMNIPLMITALIRLRKDFAVKTVIATTLISLIMALMENTHFMRFTEDRLLSAVYSGIIYGIGLGMLFERGGSSGGSEIVANLIIKRNPNAKVTRLIMIMDVIVILAGAVVFDGWSVVYAIICSVTLERSMAVYLGKGKTGGMYYIITDQPDALAEELGRGFHREGICYPAFGARTGNRKTLMQLFLPAGSQAKAKAIIEKTDPAAFSFVISVHTEGKGNRI
jgi:uncharacterized membrane-anchored protein YitT (DUF2179 family)